VKKTEEKLPPSLALVVAAGAAAGLSFGLAFAKAMAESSSVSPSYAWGAGVGAGTAAGIIWPGLWLLFSQIVPRFRAARSRYRAILLACLFVFGLHALNAVLPRVNAALGKHRDALREKVAEPRQGGTPDLRFAALPPGWKEENVAPPDGQIIRMEHFSSADGMKQIVTNVIKNPSGDVDLPRHLEGFKASLSQQGFRFVKETPLTFGQTSGAWLSGTALHGGLKVHSMALYAVNSKRAYTVFVTNTSAPVEQDRDLADFMKSIRIE
jgi:hypothetical protein